MSTTVEQRNCALERANERRLAIANISDCIKALNYAEGCRLVADLLTNPSEHVGAFKIGRLLCSIRRVGEAQERKWLNAARVWSADRRVRQLTDRQRRVLVRELS